MRSIIAFDLDDTLAVAKSPISDRMSELLGRLLEKFEVCVISGGKFEQFKLQLIERLEVSPQLLRKLHIMPTCGTRYYRYDEVQREWKQLYAEDFTDTEKKKIIAALTNAAKECGYWTAKPYGEIIEDRLSQVTLSALGQQAPSAEKYKWDPDGTKKKAIRDRAAEQLPEFEVRTGGTTSVDVTKRGIDKAYGMKKLMEILEVGKDDVLFMGDALHEGGNDYPVKAMGIDSIQVSNWEDTALALTAILHVI